jgi:hypothetical protein
MPTPIANGEGASYATSIRHTRKSIQWNALRASDTEGRGDKLDLVEVLLPSSMEEPKAPGIASAPIPCIAIESPKAAFV